MPLQVPWNDWYHCNGNTYGTWLPGDPRGYRTRDHREHVDGDYKKPPPPGKYDEQRERAYRRLRRPPIFLDPHQRRLALDAFVEKLIGDSIELLSAAIDDHHFHLLARFPDRQPKHWIGRSKMHSSMELRAAGLKGGVWAVGCRTLPITDRPHQINVFNYIVKHRSKGAAVWTYRDDRIGK